MKEEYFSRPEKNLNQKIYLLIRKKKLIKKISNLAAT
jgi:hypothetical protein